MWRGATRGLAAVRQHSLLNSREKHTLVLVRHGESEWNKENRFTGWYDVPLSSKGHSEAQEAGKLLKSQGFQFDVAYTSYLKRAIRTLWHILEETDQMWLPVNRSWRLNERHYGALTGLDKKETAEKHGAEKVLLWRRSYDVPPPQLDESNEHYPGHDVRYRSLSRAEIPKSESLHCTSKRVLPIWENEIAPRIRQGERVLITAHGNSLRALVKHLDNISKDEITELNIPTGIPLMYELDEDLKPICQAEAIGPLSGRYLGDQEAIQAKILGVKNQTK